MLSHVDLFSGIGGFALAARWAGVETIAFAEIDSYASRVIERHFPGVRNYGRVQNVPAIEGVWLVTGGVPCQPASVAGKRRGADDDRWLWPEALAAVERIAPRWVIFENPCGILSLNDGVEFERICTSLEGQGYEVQPLIIPACAVGAPHRRDRIWIVAHAQSQQDRGLQFARVSPDVGAGGNRKNVADANEEQQRGLSFRASSQHTCIGVGLQDIRNPSISGLPEWAGGETGQPWPLTEFERSNGDGKNREVERDFRGISYGVSRRVDRLKCLGNSIVPQVAYQLIKRMKEAEMFA